LAAFNVASVATWIAAAVASRRHRQSLAMWLIYVEVVVHAVMATMALGWDSGFQYYLIPLIPFVMFNDRLRTPSVVGASVGVFVAFVALHALAEVKPLDPRIGTLMVNANIAIPFTAMGLVTFFFRLASMTVEQHMEQMALTDPLTGLYNRRHMEALLHESTRRAQIEGRPFCVVMADIDRFKTINDHLGHDAGDRVLRAVASVFQDVLRAGDAVARWGGEEFLVLLPGANLNQAVEVAHRLRDATESRSSAMAQVPVGVTLTLGLASSELERSVPALIKSADEALYRGKRAGRNRVVVAGTNPTPGPHEAKAS
jgi:diguanylate cyclase (GGDEF)-like protein